MSTFQEAADIEAQTPMAIIPQATPAPTPEDVEAARELYQRIENGWHDASVDDYDEWSVQQLAQALARARQDEGRDAERLKEMAEQGWYLSAHLDGYWEVCVSLGHVVSRGQTYREAIDAAMRRAEEDG